MQVIFLRWMVLTIAVWVAAWVVPGVDYTNWQSLLAASLVLGILNAFVKPLFAVLSFPFIVLSLGLFLVVINALLLWMTSWLVEGFRVVSFWSALGGALIISVVNLFFSREKKSSAIRVRMHHETPRTRKPPKGKGPIIDV
ncbi:MAG: phage holin family protein [Verrucomicrobiota bacterium]